jgi:predicted nucleic acid-binding protein
MIVVDTNIIVYLFFESDRSPSSEQAFQKDPVWLAPLLWRSEFRNVLAFYLRKGLISLADAHEIMDQAERLMQDKEFEVQSLQVLNLIASSTCSAYDCEFVALAGDLNLPLVTVDQQILEQFPRIALSLDAFVVR